VGHVLCTFEILVSFVLESFFGSCSGHNVRKEINYDANNMGSC